MPRAERLRRNLLAGRKRLGLSQEQLAEKLGVSANSVYAWEKGSSSPKLDVIDAIENLFGSDPFIDPDDSEGGRFVPGPELRIYEEEHRVLGYLRGGPLSPILGASPDAQRRHHADFEFGQFGSANRVLTVFCFRSNTRFRI